MRMCKDEGRTTARLRKGLLYSVIEQIERHICTREVEKGTGRAMVHSLLTARRVSRLLTAARARAGYLCVCMCVKGLDAGRVQLSLCVPFDRRHMISVNSSHHPRRRTFLNRAQYKSFRSGDRK